MYIHVKVLCIFLYWFFCTCYGELHAQETYEQKPQVKKIDQEKNVENISYANIDWAAFFKQFRSGSEIQINVGLPGVFSLSIPLREIQNNPVTSAGIVSLLVAGAYWSTEYWYVPLVKYLKSKQGHTSNHHHDKDNFSDFTKSAARIYKVFKDYKLSDVAGLQSAKLDVQDIIQFLKNPKAYTDMGAKIPKGVLMQGPPGNGKTLLAKAIAGEVECPFINVCASEFIEMFVGAGAARIRDLFAKAKELAPCIIFIDEFDAIAKARSSVSLGGGADEYAQTLGQLLTLMDGFDMQKHPIIVLAATNRVDVLDPAILRPGRFDRIVEVTKPYYYDRIEILKLHFKKVKAVSDINFELIARVTKGFSGADLAHLVNEAAILAVNNKSPWVTMKHVDQAYDNITLGRETKGMLLLKDEIWQTAIHEAGHSIVRVFLQHADPLYKVTIAPRGKALGLSYWLPLKEKYCMTEDEMKAQIVVCLAGGLAELEFGFGKTTGLYSDLQKARDLAYQMVAFYGMSADLGYMSYAEIDHHLSNDVATKIHEEVKKIIDECYKLAQSLVHEHQDYIEQLADRLLEEGTVFGNEVYQMCGVQEPSIDYGLV